jgi:hypothetical protein
MGDSTVRRLVFVAVSALALGCLAQIRNAPEEPEWLRDYPASTPITTKEEAVARYEEWVDYLQKHVQPRILEYPDTRKLYVGMDESLFGDESFYTVRGPAGLFWFRPESGDLTSFTLFLGRKYAKEGREPTLTQEEAISEAQRYAEKLFLNPHGIELQWLRDPDRTQYLNQMPFGGKWAVWAYRVVGGITAPEGIVIYVDEEAGIAKYSNNISGQCRYFTDKNVGKQEAVDIAKPKAKTLLDIISTNAWYQWGKGYKVGDLYEVTLEFCLSNNIFEPGVTHTTFRTGYNELRLCWVVTFKGEPEQEGPESIYLTIYVDAGTGKVIGGAF